jgi:hypothetical protein
VFLRKCGLWSRLTRIARTIARQRGHSVARIVLIAAPILSTLAVDNMEPKLSGKPLGRKAMTPTQRQRRWRANLPVKAKLARRQALLDAVQLPDDMEPVRIGDCREVLADIEDNSVHLILTDPPYGNAAEPLYVWLAEFAARVLVPGGSLICYTGLTLLDRDMRIFGEQERLTHWTPCVLVHDRRQKIWGNRVLANHKPILWYVKDGFRRAASDGKVKMVPTVVRATRDKSLHDWAQGDGGVRQWIEQLTEPGELIVDPYAGTAAWGRIAHSLKRRWIGCDIVAGGSTTVPAA